MVIFREGFISWKDNSNVGFTRNFLQKVNERSNSLGQWFTFFEADTLELKDLGILRPRDVL